MELSNTQKVLLLVSVPATGVLLYLLLRRQDDEEDKEHVVTSRQTVIELPVPRSAVGGIIGAQGANIKQLQDASGARINFKDATSEEEDRIVVIRGTPENAQKAELMIRKAVADQPPILTEIIYVPQTAVGRIIGRNGENIRQLCRISKAKIFVERSEERRKDKMREVTIKGTSNAIANAKDLLAEKVQEEEAMRAKLALTASNRQQRVHRSRDRQLSPEAPVSPPLTDDIDAAGAAGVTPAAAATVEAAAESEQHWPDHRDYMEVFVSAVEHPSHFWVQVLSSHSAQLDRLMTDMTVYYSNPTVARESCVQKPEVGMLVGATFKHDPDGLWYRAEIHEVKEGELDLYYVDYGDSEWVNTDKVMKLRSDFLHLPFQAFECSLAQIKPVGEEWSEEATILFEELSHVAKWKPLQARTVCYQRDSSGSMPCVELVDTHSAEDVNLAAELVHRSLAVWTSQSPDGASEPDLSSSQSTEAAERILVDQTFTGMKSPTFMDRYSDAKNTCSPEEGMDSGVDLDCSPQAVTSVISELVLDTGQPPAPPPEIDKHPSVPLEELCESFKSGNSPVSFEESNDWGFTDDSSPANSGQVMIDHKEPCMENTCSSSGEPSSLSVSSAIPSLVEDVTSDVSLHSACHFPEIKLLDNFQEEEKTEPVTDLDVNSTCFELAQHKLDACHNSVFNPVLSQSEPYWLTSPCLHDQPVQESDVNLEKECVHSVCSSSSQLDKVATIKDSHLLNRKSIECESGTAVESTLTTKHDQCPRVVSPHDIHPHQPGYPMLILEEVITETEVTLESIVERSPQNPASPEVEISEKTQVQSLKFLTKSILNSISQRQNISSPPINNDSNDLLPGTISQHAAVKLQESTNHVSHFPNRDPDASASGNIMGDETEQDNNALCLPLSQNTETMQGTCDKTDPRSPGLHQSHQSLVDISDSLSDLDSRSEYIESNSGVKYPSESPNSEQLPRTKCTSLDEETNVDGGVNDKESVYKGEGLPDYEMSRTELPKLHHIISFVPELSVSQCAQDKVLLSPVPDTFRYCSKDLASSGSESGSDDNLSVCKDLDSLVDLNLSADSLESCQLPSPCNSPSSDVGDDCKQHSTKHSSASGTFAHGGPPLVDSPVSDLPDSLSASGYLSTQSECKQATNLYKSLPEVTSVANRPESETFDADSLEDSGSDLDEDATKPVLAFSSAGGDNCEARHAINIQADESLSDSLEDLEVPPPNIQDDGGSLEKTPLLDKYFLTAKRADELRPVVSPESECDEEIQQINVESLQSDQTELHDSSPFKTSSPKLCGAYSPEHLKQLPSMHSFDDLDMLDSDKQEQYIVPTTLEQLDSDLPEDTSDPGVPALNQNDCLEQDLQNLGGTTELTPPSHSVAFQLDKEEPVGIQIETSASPGDACEPLAIEKADSIFASPLATKLEMQSISESDFSYLDHLTPGPCNKSISQIPMILTTDTADNAPCPKISSPVPCAVSHRDSLMSADSLGSTGSTGYWSSSGDDNTCVHSLALLADNVESDTCGDEVLSDDSLDIVFHTSLDSVTNLKEPHISTPVEHEHESHFSDDSIEEAVEGLEMFSHSTSENRHDCEDAFETESPKQHEPEVVHHTHYSVVPLRCRNLDSILEEGDEEEDLEKESLDLNGSINKHSEMGGIHAVVTPPKQTYRGGNNHFVPPQANGSTSKSPSLTAASTSSSQTVKPLSPKSSLKRPGSGKKNVKVRFMEPDKLDENVHDSCGEDEDYETDSSEEGGYYLYNPSSGQMRPEEYAYEEDVTAL